ncbi:MAG: ABC transporter substrate-binding protein [Dehalococcoidia bacterium]|nr:ABC transporter substrate-binding protein [Dehalococcoidia bacterium]
MRPKRNLWCEVLILMLALVLMVPLLAACGDDDEEESTTPVVTTTTPAPTVSSEPVKIGVLSPYSGPYAAAGALGDEAISVVMKQVEKMGGILGGRSIKVIKFDDQSQVANTKAGYTKLAQNEKVSAVLFGGGSSPQLSVASDAAEEVRVPVFSLGATPKDISDRPYTVRTVMPNLADVGDSVVDFILNKLKPKTVALLCMDDVELRDENRAMRQKLEAAGVNVSYEQYVPQGTVDLSSYLTRVKYENPDILLTNFASEQCLTILIQIVELGGWGNIKWVSWSAASASRISVKPEAAEGTYHWVYWVPGLNYPGAKEMEQAYLETVGHLPSTAAHYYAFWVCIKAIELAGSDDPVEIAKAARSGDLRWESPGGPYTIQPDGVHSNDGEVLISKGGKLVQVE